MIRINKILLFSWGLSLFFYLGAPAWAQSSITFTPIFSDRTDLYPQYFSTQGDINCDGYQDLIIHWEDKLNIYYGRDDFNYSKIDQLTPDDAITINNDIYYSDEPWQVHTGADLDGDGCADLVYNYLYASQINIIYGRTEKFNSAREADLIAATFVPRNEYSNLRTIKSGDIDGDGYTDIIVSDTGDLEVANDNYPGYLDIIYGDPQRYAGTDFFPARIIGEQKSGWAGFGASFALGDLNGDGRQDIAALSLTQGSNSKNNKVFIIYGQKNKYANLSVDDPAVKKILTGKNKQIFQDAYSLVRAGDADGDGFADIFIRAKNADYLIYGKSDQFSEQKYLRQITRKTKFQNRKLFLNLIPDINQDGRADFINSYRLLSGKKNLFKADNANSRKYQPQQKMAQKYGDKDNSYATLDLNNDGVVEILLFYCHGYSGTHLLVASEL